jgi:hypothetical protein
VKEPHTKRTQLDSSWRSSGTMQKLSCNGGQESEELPSAPRGTTPMLSRPFQDTYGWKQAYIYRHASAYIYACRYAANLGVQDGFVELQVIEQERDAHVALYSLGQRKTSWNACKLNFFFFDFGPVCFISLVYQL